MNLKEKVISILSASCTFPSVLVVAGYFLSVKSNEIYSTLGGNLARFLPYGLIGFATGIMGSRFVPFNYDQVKRSPEVGEKTDFIKRTTEYASTYLVAPLLLIGSITLLFKNFIHCNGNALKQCPLSFELTGNYVNFDGKGLGLFTLAVLIAYYARKVFKKMHQSESKTIKGTGRFFLNAMDKYQFDLISLIPLALFTSGQYLVAYSAYSSYNPYLLLTLVGYTFGVYKEQINSRTGDVNIGMMLTPF